MNDPESFPARLGLAYVAVHKGEAPESLRWATEAVQMRPDMYQSHYYLGQLLLRHDQAEQACVELEAARGLSASNSGVRYALAKAYRALGRKGDAERELKEFERLKALEEAGKAARTLPRSGDAGASAAPATPTPP
jgi:Flp pilus assembly protein TadD